MIFTQRLRDGVRRGEITCSVRIWTRPHVRVAGRYRMEKGEIDVDLIESIGLPNGAQSRQGLRRRSAARRGLRKNRTSHGEDRWLPCAPFPPCRRRLTTLPSVSRPGQRPCWPVLK
jgi:hypothetical protein